jgi:hypothetical protein
MFLFYFYDCVSVHYSVVHIGVGSCEGERHL